MNFSSTGSDLNLLAETRRFATELTATARVITPNCDPFEAQIVRNRVKVHQSPREGIRLNVNKQPLMTLKADFSCTWDSRGMFLMVERSSFGLYPGASGKQPLFRYEYVRDAKNVPAAHLHVHAHRDAFTYTMTKVGNSTQRARERGDSTADAIPSMQDLHFPLGGHRFRPSLEDVLEMLIEEFGVDREPEARQTLGEARARWRLIQTMAAVRDAPGAAVESLRSLGYTIEPPGTGDIRERHEKRLRAL